MFIADKYASVMRHPWQDRVPITIWRCTSPCAAIAVFIVLWIAMGILTLLRFNDTGLRARMDVEARTLVITANDGETPDQLRTRIEVQAIAPAARFQWQWSMGESPTAAEERHQQFLESAANLAKSESDKPGFAENFVRLDALSKTFSDRPLTERPSFLRRAFLSYYSIDGVHFRELEDLSQARRLANDYLRFRQRNNELHGFDEIIRPWGLLTFYDPKRAQLNDLLPVACFLLILVTRFLLSYRYYDVSVERKDGELFIHHKPRTEWIHLWEHPLIDGQEHVATKGHKWPIALIVGIAVALSVEFKTNDPEIWAERIVNIPMMVVAGALLIVVFVTLASLISSRFSSRFRSQSLFLRGKILLPLTITLIFGVTALTVRTAVFSWDQLMTRPMSDMATRGRFQLVLCAVLELFALLALANMYRKNPGGGPNKSDEDEKYNPPDPGCLSRIGIQNIDEKMIIAIAVTLAPCLGVIKEIFFS